ncbi:MAG: hypothetical protein CFH01_01416 [Alphaproteobacteria bacterium MarineAlpha2_Bin1]|nr:MAG: hypothetical protein CFH01_01416 [Alphaproteobacteria bacterium MarineAlpha2_Bin1]
MSEFEKSREKFEEALLNLEQIVDQMVDKDFKYSQRGSDKKIIEKTEDLTILKKERDELKLQLLEATENYNSLSTVTTQLSNRLDETIKKLKSVLE